MNFILALVPIVWLIVAMSVIKLPGYKACLIALAVAAVEGCFIFGLTPVETLTAALEGILNALWPIILVIIAALFTYNMTLETGAMEDIKRMLGSLSNDNRILMLIIAWGFGNFMEGMAGFGTAVAIPAGMLVGVGFDPILAVVACLVINSTPTVFGSVGVPATTLAGIAGLDILTLTRYAATIQFVLTFLSPFLAVIIIGGGLKAMKGMFPFTLIASLSFVIPQFLTAAFIGAELPNILGSIISMVIMVAAAKLLPHQVEPEYLITSSGKKEQPMTLQKGLTAWAPFIFTFLFLLLTSNLVPVIHDPLAAIKSSVQVYAGESDAVLAQAYLQQFLHLSIRSSKYYYLRLVPAAYECENLVTLDLPLLDGPVMHLRVCLAPFPVYRPGDAGVRLPVVGTPHLQRELHPVQGCGVLNRHEQRLARPQGLEVRTEQVGRVRGSGGHPYGPQQFPVPWIGQPARVLEIHLAEALRIMQHIPGIDHLPGHLRIDLLLLPGQDGNPSRELSLFRYHKSVLL